MAEAGAATFPSSSSWLPSSYCSLRRSTDLSPLICRSRGFVRRVLSGHASLSSSRSHSPTRITNCASTTTTTIPSSGRSELEVAEIRERCSRWTWRGYSVNYFVDGVGGEDRPALLLVHGFGASIPHWRRNIMQLTFWVGSSDKPAGFQYTTEKWAENADHPVAIIFNSSFLISWMKLFKTPTILIGNSVGSLFCVIAASGL